MERTIITYKVDWMTLTSVAQFYNVVARYNDEITINSKYASLILKMKRI